ncbi:hypothetical protein BDR26DRAFT_858159 [Obelidium mucronatum]|nr:hypothetical protein BDR26DRAFT_858159 [Obelidium mucronatum]
MSTTLQCTSYSVPATSTIVGIACVPQECSNPAAAFSATCSAINNTTDATKKYNECTQCINSSGQTREAVADATPRVSFEGFLTFASNGTATGSCYGITQFVWAYKVGACLPSPIKTDVGKYTLIEKASYFSDANCTVPVDEGKSIYDGFRVSCASQGSAGSFGPVNATTTSASPAKPATSAPVTSKSGAFVVTASAALMGFLLSIL